MKKRLLLIFILISLIFTLDKNNFIAAKMGGYTALKLIENSRVESFCEEFLTYESKHFIIRYTNYDKKIIDKIAQMFERSYLLVGQAYDHYPEEKIKVFMYSNKEQFWRYQKVISGQAVMGLFNMGIIHILSPNAYFNDSEKFLEYYEKDGPILHEYTHKVVDELCGGNIELWFTEGIALYEEYSLNKTEWAKDYDCLPYYTTYELRRNFIKLDPILSYRQSFINVKELIENHGKEKLIMLLEKLKSCEDFDEAFYDVYGFCIQKK